MQTVFFNKTIKANKKNSTDIFVFLRFFRHGRQPVAQEFFLHPIQVGFAHYAAVL